MGFFSSKQKSRSESSLEPYTPALPGMMEGIGNVTNWMAEPQEFFPGQTYAGQTAAEQQAIDQLKAGAGAYPGMAAGLYGQAAGAMGTLAGAPQAALGMGLTDVAANPAVQAQAEAIQSRVNRNLMENILPQIKAGEVMGPSGAVSRGIAARGTSEALSSALAGLYGGAYQAGLGAETARYGAGLGAAGQAMRGAPGLAQFGLSQYTQPASLLGRAGGLERAEEQRGITEAMQRHEFEQMEPFRRSQMGLGVLSPMAAQFGRQRGESEVKSQPSGFSTLGQTLGAIGGLGGGLTSLFGAGGALGGLFGGNPYAAEPMMGGYGTMGAGPWGVAGPAGYGGYGSLYG